jgi:hypothetical protein
VSRLELAETTGDGCHATMWLRPEAAGADRIIVETGDGLNSYVADGRVSLGMDVAPGAQLRIYAVTFPDGSLLEDRVTSEVAPLRTATVTDDCTLDRRATT